MGSNISHQKAAGWTISGWFSPPPINLSKFPHRVEVVGERGVQKKKPTGWHPDGLESFDGFSRGRCGSLGSDGMGKPKTGEINLNREGSTMTHGMVGGSPRPRKKMGSTRRLFFYYPCKCKICLRAQRSQYELYVGWKKINRKEVFLFFGDTCHLL